MGLDSLNRAPAAKGSLRLLEPSWKDRGSRLVMQNRRKDVTHPHNTAYKTNSHSILDCPAFLRYNEEPPQWRVGGGPLSHGWLIRLYRRLAGLIFY